MNTSTILKELESLGSEQTRKTYRRHGAPEPLFGVKYGDLGKLKKRIKINHDLAVQLWKSGNCDARTLATMIADPTKATDALLEQWIGDCVHYGLVDAIVAYVAQSPLAQSKMERWISSKEEWRGAGGWMLLVHLAAKNSQLRDDFFETYLPKIGEGIHQAPNRVRYAMNNALIAIGGRSEVLEKKAVAIARRIGKVEVDHGDTACETPDAKSYILKVRAYRDKKTKLQRV